MSAPGRRHGCGEILQGCRRETTVIALPSRGAGTEIVRRTWVFRTGSRDSLLSLVHRLIGEQEGALWDALGLLFPGVGNEEMHTVVIKIKGMGDEDARFDFTYLAALEQVYGGNPGDSIGR
jgi:hypothetical protein